MLSCECVVWWVLLIAVFSEREVGLMEAWEGTRRLHSSVVTVTGKGVNHPMLFYKLVLLEDKNQFIGFSEIASYIRKADVL